MDDKWSIKPETAGKMVDILFFMADKDHITTNNIVQKFALPPTTAKRYLRNLVEMNYIKAYGGNKNRTYSSK